MKAGFFYIILATLLFSTMEIALKSVGGQFNSVQINLTRFLIGGIVLIPLAIRALRQRAMFLNFRAILSFAFLGFLCCVVSMTCFQLAVENANASVVAVLFSCNPVFVFLFAFLIMRVVLLRRHILALLMECLGILLLINPLHTSISCAGIIFSLLATVTFALYAVLGARQCELYSGIVVTCGSFLCGSVEMLLLVVFSYFEPIATFLSSNGLSIFADIPLFQGYTAQNFPVMLYICFGVTGAGFACYFMAMQATSPVTASLVFFLKPALAPIFAFFLLGEPIPFNMVLGIFLILAGSLVSLPPLPVFSRVWRRLHLRRFFSAHL